MTATLIFIGILWYVTGLICMLIGTWHDTTYFAEHVITRGDILEGLLISLAGPLIIFFLISIILDRNDAKIREWKNRWKQWMDTPITEFKRKEDNGNQT